MNTARYHANDNELIYMVRMQDHYAFRLLLEKYEKYLYSLINRFAEYEIKSVKEEMAQECRIMLLDLCMTFRDDRAGRFITYLVKAIKQKIGNLQKGKNIEFRNMHLVSLDACVRDGEDELLSILDTGNMSYRPEYEWRYLDSVERLKALVDSLSKQERDIWNLMNQDVSNDDAALQMGCTRKQYEYLRLKLKRKIISCVLESEKIRKH